MARVLFDEISNNPDLALDLGSRHKAAVGATEHESGCIAVVVSEETGKISFAHEGELEEGLTAENLRKRLVKRLVREDESSTQKGALRKRKKSKR